MFSFLYFLIFQMFKVFVGGKVFKMDIRQRFGLVCV